MVICSDPQRRLGAAAGQTVMPRPREFDETSALEAAVQCFWQHGYEATSLRDLTASMGLTAPSLYNAFGDKEQLFARALDQYLDRTTRGRLRRLEESLAPKEALRRFFAEIVDHSIKDLQRKGCFLVNSALEVAPHHAECRAVIAKQFGEIEAFFRRCIGAGQADRTISRDVDAIDAARLFLGVLLGVRVLARTNPDRGVLEGVVRPALALLNEPRRNRSKR
jgi:TetR/AcrR family transcriptional regulator, transcriptional repressor for nem operon